MNLGHPGLNELPLATRKRISKIIEHFYGLEPGSYAVVSILLLTYYKVDFESTLETLESWQKLQPKEAFEQIHELEQALKGELLESRA